MLDTPINNILIHSYVYFPYIETNSYKGGSLGSKEILTNAIINDSGSRDEGTYTKNSTGNTRMFIIGKHHYPKNSLIFDYDSNTKYSVNGYVHQKFPETTTYWFTEIFLVNLGFINE